MSLTEIEHKYIVSGSFLRDTFIKKVRAGVIPEYNDYVFIDSGDDYFHKTGNRDEVVRVRYTLPELDVREITFKRKPEGALTNTIRREININIGDSSLEECNAIVTDMGWEYDFTISKKCHIYDYDNVDLSFYSVWDAERQYPVFFLEIESKRDVLEDIEVFERDILSELGLGESDRCPKSLFELYHKGD